MKRRLEGKERKSGSPFVLQGERRGLGSKLIFTLTGGLCALVALGCGRRVELLETLETSREREALYSGSFFSGEEEAVLAPGPERAAFLDNEVLAKEAEECRRKILAAQETVPLPGATKLSENRAQVLARAKAEPVLFLQTPEYKGEVSRGTEARRKLLLTTEFPQDIFRSTISTFRDNPLRLRELLLRDGYLYTDDPRSARLLTLEVTLELLFHREDVILERGAERLLAKAGEDGIYYFANGSEKGQRARILLFDRVHLASETPNPPIHVDVREFAQREGITEMRLAHLGFDQIVAEVQFEREWVPALLSRDGVELSLECLLIEPEDAARVGRDRDAAYRRASVLRSLRQAIAEQVELGLPFDEPKTERGQQDGKLRAKWEQAYFGKRESYTFNGDKYPVYNAQGQALAPQVCIDFVTETFERASGMHFTDSSLGPRKVLGALDFDELLQGGRRQEMAMRTYARANPHRLEILDYPIEGSVAYEKVEEFFQFLEREKENIRPGDIVIIRGRAAWDRYAEVHTHTFFLYESDPITGMPMLLAGNAGKPRISTFDGEMLRAPKRSIRHRIRPNMDWLYDHVVVRTPLRGERWAAPLSVTER